ncbi:MAG: FAD-dependent oxidoreductase [Desulfomonilaceae bacterium]
MKSIIFGRWGKVLRYRKGGDDIFEGGSQEDFPSESSFPDNVIAVMSGKGFLQFGERFNFVPMITEYVKQIQTRYCCGKCITGIKGSKLILMTLDRIMRGEGQESDLDILRRMSVVLNEGAKCSVCQSAGELLADGLVHYKSDFLKALEYGVPEDSIHFVGSVSAPCMNTCPCHINIPGYVEMLQELRYGEALEIIRREMPLPGITGRICPAPCEKACSVANMGDVAIPIKTLKRVAADYEMIHHLRPPLEKVDLNGVPVAVVGAGPAGLTAAYYLNRLGHPVTIFECLSESGGMVSVGIPPYRQPRDVLNREIGILTDLGIEIKRGLRLGTHFSLSDLFRDGYGAVFLGMGSHKSTPLGIKGEKDGIEGVFSGGIDFLRNINLGESVQLGEKVIVVGGGNTAIDCARTCLRMGSLKVAIVYRRTQAEMPAELEEVEDAAEEGIEFHFLTQPIEIVHKDGKMIGLKCVRMQLGEPDKSGRRRPVPVEGSEFVMDADTLIPAIGQTSDLDFLSPADQIEITRHVTIKVDPTTMMTSRLGVFAAGDAVSGPLTVVHAMAGGKRAARMIHEYLTSGRCIPPESQWMEDVIAKIEADRGVLVTARTPSREGGKISRAKLEPRERISNFREVDSGFTQKGSFIEASRCLRCFHLILLAVGGEAS